MIVGALAAGLAIAAFALPAAAAAQPLPPSVDADHAVQADTAAVDAYVAGHPAAAPGSADGSPSQAAMQVMRWVSASGDNGGLPFMIIDKTAGEVFAFDAEGQPVGKAPALTGITPGDDTVPGVGDRELSKIPVADRTTPAGRFRAKFGPASGHRSVLWVDYADSVSLHPVITANPKEHRLQRINSPAPDDNRITFGCINVPTHFTRKWSAPCSARRLAASSTFFRR